MTKHKIISVFQHPSNTDPTAKLVSGASWKPAIYSVSGGFVACLGGGRCLDGLFRSKELAETAIWCTLAAEREVITESAA